MALRLDKYLTELGAGTRSEVKKQIKAGLVTVNGAVAKKPEQKVDETGDEVCPVSYTHLRAHETGRNLVCRLLLEKKKKQE